jgi:hypothetical protein
MKKQLSLLFIFSFIGIYCFAQDDLMKMAQLDAKPDNNITIATFKDSRLIDQQTLECLGPQTLNVEISHRFGQINSGSYNAWGIDGPANIRIGLDYSYDGRLMAGIGRTSDEKLFDGYLQYRLIRQKDDGSMPVSVTLFTSMAYTTLQNLSGEPEIYFYESDRLSYAHEIMVGRKFTPRFSLQLSGYLIHSNVTQNIGDKNDIYAIGGATRYKLTKSFALTAEYAYCLNNYYATVPNVHYYNSMGVGFEIETGGHVFQILLTNSFGLNETEFVPFTTASWSNAGIRVGFNISRVFHV